MQELDTKRSYKYKNIPLSFSVIFRILITFKEDAIMSCILLHNLSRQICPVKDWKGRVLKVDNVV